MLKYYYFHFLDVAEGAETALGHISLKCTDEYLIKTEFQDVPVPSARSYTQTRVYKQINANNNSIDDDDTVRASEDIKADIHFDEPEYVWIFCPQN